ncbi:rod shape-determining protein MreD [Turneriella parva]|uniref:Rod shape-determining protein MreD n=1 Tax=Turneriella parva (strain ATCC BAA-1111 / DSM 21527 / NCTC 11395 / H) TaxID=869212 RepID=I4B5Z3_TURPD|nr:rod shape-determining protein MreD [Turneriella parva]AFM12700.1 rod shape-determining protein MreD [Turneriella parva DSM 21527]
MILEKIVIGIAIFVSYFLQTSVDFFALGSVKPDFLLILTVYFALYRGSFAALWIGFFGGLLQDINLGGYTNLVKQDMQYYIGTSALAKTIIGYVSGKVARDINKDATSLIVIVVFVACLLKGILMFFTVAIFHSSAHAASLITIVLPEALFTAILSIVWFRLLRWAFPTVEKTEGQRIIRRLG